ncbi:MULTISPECIES: alpha/beta hydrolase [Clostridium]|uniref:Alpha/beta hydrolase n=1 Tax=Clostridium nitritogenes TaxID=83340 RepID=A0ABN1LI03_9CLOT|nr:alpha/beta hydrolase [Clostridium baratii]MBT9832184.1 alpha/beta hydrolase [Clostridium baratii]MDU1855398.1 alpha/beta hydrolase [Clostridium baratii]STA98994.1 alpha/beta fold family hydrolase [Clostridium baratii]
MLVNKKNVKFNARGLKVAGILNIPENAEDKKNPAIVCVHPGSSCKEQTAGIYAEKFAELGYVTIVFDASYQGESEGEPRYIEDPSARVEDIRSAVDYLTTLDFVDENRIGVLGVCAGGGYAVNAAMTERRIKAVGTVVGANIGRVNRESSDPIKTLEAIAEQRTAEARGAERMITNWIPRNQEEREQAGITDIDIVEAVDYYTTSRGQSPNSSNKLNFISLDAVIGFDAFHLADELLTQPLQIIVGSVQGAFGSYRDGHELYNKAASKKKDLFIVEGASHYDLYDREEPVRKAVEKLEAFYKENL